VVWRTDDVHARREDFSYDGLNRVTTARLTDTGGGGQLSLTTYQYDAVGNIKHKSDVGAYAYNGIDGGPHAVTAAGVNTYADDLNGNMVDDPERFTCASSVAAYLGSTPRH
jgi:hypothetical protein